MLGIDAGKVRSKYLEVLRHDWIASWCRVGDPQWRREEMGHRITEELVTGLGEIEQNYLHVKRLVGARLEAAQIRLAECVR